MTHPFGFTYGGKTHYFAFDSESGSLHNVDYVTFLCIKERLGLPFEGSEAADLRAISQTEKSEINSELDQLKADGVFDSPCTVTQKKKRTGEIKAVEVGLRAVDFLIANSGKRKSLEIDFFGGEPLMNMTTVKAVVEYARSLEASTGKTFSFTMTTNCLLLNEENRKWLNDNMYNVVLSIDGRREIHNAVRKTPNGADAFDVILNNALEFRKIRGDKSYYVRGTFTAKNLDFCEDVLYLNDCGFDQISMEPVVTDLPDLQIRKEHLPRIFEEYEKLAAAYIDRRRTEDKWFNFFHFMYDLEGGPCVIKRLTGCGSGCEYLAVTPRGDIYPCHQFAERKPYKMGNVLEGTGYDMSVSEIFAGNIVTNKPDCTNCPAKYYCSGGCVANNLNFAGDMNKPYDISCAMMKKRFELSLAIAAIEGAGE